MANWLRKLLFCGALVLLVNPTVSMSMDVPNDICQVRIDEDGNCRADILDQAVTIEGIVVAWKHFGSRGPGAIYDPQSGCCISIFDITNAPDIPIGHRISVTGWTGQFAGLDEIVDDPANGANDPIVTDLGFEINPECAAVSGADLQDNSPTAEGMESCLASLCGVFVDAGETFAGNANYEFVAEDGNSVVVRIDIDTDIDGTAIPVGSVTVCGVVSQFDNFTGTCGGYQLLPRSQGDFSEAPCEPVQVEETTWGRVKSISR